MIVTTIDKLTKYSEIPYAQDIVDFLDAFRKTEMVPGRYDIHGDDLFAAVSRYDTEPNNGERKFENHRKYIDLQIVFGGKEEIHWADTKTLTMVSEEYSKGGDIAFYTGESMGYILLGGEQCAILFEEDAHMPNVLHEKSENVLKIVFKIKAGE
ncbi:MAG: YhcH/YjgK/YiaL family protein [Clostridia bacterium]|nr:YhcH/YjgK/YiaL family protein [Clostridia bacterium]